MNLTWEELARYAFSPDGRDSARNISDEELARAIAATGNLLDASMLLSEARGRIIARTDIAARVEASPKLAAVLEVARETYMQRAVDRGRQVIAERQQERQRVLQKWYQVREERVRLCELRRVRNHGPRCGAKTQAGVPCKRRPELGKARCRCHGGCSTGARTREGLARALAVLERGRETQQLRRSAAS